MDEKTKDRVADIIEELAKLADELGELEEGPLRVIIMAAIAARLASNNAESKLMRDLALPCADFLIAMASTI